jgi:hypothetical protein
LIFNPGALIKKGQSAAGNALVNIPALGNALPYRIAFDLKLGVLPTIANPTITYTPAIIVDVPASKNVSTQNRRSGDRKQ